MTSLNDLAQEIHAISKAKGFWSELDDEGVVKPWGPGGRNPFEVLALIHSDVSEALEAIRNSRWDSSVSWGRTKHTGGPDLQISSDGVFTTGDYPRMVTDQEMRHWGYIPKPEGVASELADIIIRILDACAAWRIDIETAVELKVHYNGRAV